jgi:hypothetical protein
MSKIVKTLLSAAAMVLLFAPPAGAASTRLTPVGPGYGVHDFTLTAQDEDHWYSSGLDIPCSCIKNSDLK